MVSNNCSLPMDLYWKFLPRVKYLADHLARSCKNILRVNDFSKDLVNAGMIGLIDAIKKYDPNCQTKLTTYAEFRIRGAMLDEIRSMDWAPRSVRKSQKRFVAVKAPCIASPRKYDYQTCVAVVNIGDVNALEFVDTHTTSPLSRVISNENRLILTRAISSLSKQQRMVLVSYYYKELTMKAIGMIIGVKESRVCQIHKQALAALRAIIVPKFYPEKAGGLE